MANSNHRKSGNFKSGLAGILLGTGVVFGGGCATLTPADYGAAGLGALSGYARTPQEALVIRAGGSLMGTSGQRQHDLNVAREGRTQINLGGYRSYGGYSEPEALQEDMNGYDDYLNTLKSAWNTGASMAGTKFACNFYRDSNNNGDSEFNEFSGIKKTFSSSEQITLVCWYQRGAFHYAMTGSDINLKLFSGSTGEVVLEDNWKSPGKGWIIKKELNPGTLSPGSYIIMWYFNEELIGIEGYNKEKNYAKYDFLGTRTHFRIIDSGRGNASSRQEESTIQNSKKTFAAEQLKRLKELKDAGAITEEEYQEKKRSYIDNL